MMLALDFHTRWLLVGVLAAAIPFVLHLLSAVRAPEVVFPTLRFLRISMEKTARRRRLEHWVLLAVRSLLLAALAIGVSEPFLRSVGGFRPDRHLACAVIVDNSQSMLVRSAGLTRFDRARREAGKLLGGDFSPARAEVLLTNAGPPGAGLRADLESLRTRLAGAHPEPGRAAIAQRVAEAVEDLSAQSAGQKAIYVFSDLQRSSFEDLPRLEALKQSGLPLMLVDCSDRPPVNVGIADLQVQGYRVVNRPLRFTATVVNSSPSDKVVEVWLQVDGRPAGEPVRKVLRQAGAAGDRATVTFQHAFAAPGPHEGQVVIDEADDLDLDNVRRFAFDLADRARARLVRGGDRAAMDPSDMLQNALDPYAGTALPWPVDLRALAAGQFDDAALSGASCAFFADVPSFTPAQARAIERFVRDGGSVAFFLGPSVDADNYNQRFVQEVPREGGLLPGRIDRAVGNVGLTVEAFAAVRNLGHAYLSGLYETAEAYPEVLVQRYYRLAVGPGGWERILSAPNGDPVVSAKSYGRGRVAVFGTTASTEWNRLATTPLLLPMVTRICLQSAERRGADQSYPSGAPVVIRPPAGASGRGAVNVSLPDGTVEVLPLEPGADGASATFARTTQIGTYHWTLAGAGPETPGARGTFVTNPDGSESDLARADPVALAAALKPADVYVGGTLEEVHAAAAEAAAGKELWDWALAAVILLLVTEAVIANRFRRGAEPVPAWLNPRLVRGGVPSGATAPLTPAESGVR